MNLLEMYIEETQKKKRGRGKSYQEMGFVCNRVNRQSAVTYLVELVTMIAEVFLWLETQAERAEGDLYREKGMSLVERDDKVTCLLSLIPML